MPPDITFACNAPIAPEALGELLAQTDWAKTRSHEGLERMLHQTSLHVSAWHKERLVGFARALTDGVYRAVIEDVIVTRELREQGLGRELMKHMLQELLAVEEIALGCLDNLVPFYESLGFTRVAHPYLKKR